MAADQRPRIDDELRAYAQTRRAQDPSPLELQPLVREALQEEVARTFQNAGARASTRQPIDWWRLFWPRLAIAGGLCVVAAIGLVRWLPGTSSGLYPMAKATDRWELLASQTQEIVSPQPDVETETEAVPAKTPPSPAAQPAPARPAPVQSPYAESKATPATEERDVRDGLASRADTEAAFQPALPSAPGDALSPRRGTSPQPSSERAAGGDESARLLLRQRYGLAPARTKAARSSTGEQMPAAPSPQLGAVTAETKGAVASVPGPTTQLAPTAGEMVLAKDAAGVEFRQDSSRMPRASPSASKVQVPTLDRGERADLQQVPTRAPAASAGDRSLELGQQFSQVDRYRRNFNSPARPRVLQSFRLRQDRQRLVLEDADGSLYVGSLRSDQGTGVQSELGTGARLKPELIQAGVGEARISAEEKQVGTAAPGPPASVFQVSGTNLTLNQLVVFDGRLVPSTPPPGIAGSGLHGTVVTTEGQTVWQFGSVTNMNGPVEPPQTVVLDRIQGQATIGDGTRVEIDAVPVRP
jgi:hypothetical protein